MFLSFGVALVGDTPRSVAEYKHRKVCFSQHFRTLGPSQPHWEPWSPSLMRRLLVVEQMLPDGQGSFVSIVGTPGDAWNAPSALRRVQAPVQ